MLDIQHLPPSTGKTDVQVFTGTAVTAGGDWETWVKPRGKTMLHIALWGKGGNGGSGTVQALSGGGGGGGSGAQTILTIPLSVLPDRLFLSLAGDSATTTLASYISIAPNTIANNTVAYAAGGANGVNASGGTGGTGGAGGLVATAALMPLGWSFQDSVLAGQAGSNGGTNVAGVALAIPVTGLLVTGGAGGAGTGADIGLVGGSFTVLGIFAENPHPGGTAPGAVAIPPGAGSTGRIVLPNYGYRYGGAGAGSTHSGATGAGLVQAPGGDGSYGCGGGGMGGAAVGSTASVISRGGPALAILTCW